MKKTSLPVNENESRVEKNFLLTSLSLKNRTTVLFLTAMIVVTGLYSYITLPKENYPEIKQSIVYVGTAYPGNSPVDMENLVTREIEKEVNVVTGVDLVKSTSVQGYSTVIVEFDPNVAIEDALRKVKDAVDRARPELPNDLPTEPNIFQLNFSEIPIMKINLSGDYTSYELKSYAQYLKDEVEKISEISKAEIRGIDEEEVKIQTNPYLMEARNVNFLDIENAIKAENITISGGDILDNGIRRSVRIVGEYVDPEKMKNIVVKHDGGNIVYLRDVAEVHFEYQEVKTYARLQKEPVVMIDVVKKSGYNLLATTDKIVHLVEETQKHVFPEDLKVTITNDQSSSIRDSVNGLENNIISGVIVVVFVLLLFLGTRNALFVGMAIPLSMFMSFLLLSILGITINKMVLFGLIMALGMLVDNGIVVVENIYRLREEGYPLMQASRLGVSEVAFPIISSTATTLAAFIPLALWPGIMGEFMKYLPITLIIVLFSSLFVALVINPVVISLFMKLDKEIVMNKRKIWISIIGLATIGGGLALFGVTTLGNILIIFAVLTVLNVYFFVPFSKIFQQKLLPRMEVHYTKLVTFALNKRNPIWVFIGTVGLLLFSFWMMAVFTPKVLFFPVNEPSYVNVFIEFPLGTDIQETNTFTEKIEDKVFDLVAPYKSIVKSVVTNVGSGAGDSNGEFSSGQGSHHKGQITVNFLDYKYRNGISTSEVMDKVREGIGHYLGVVLTVDKNKGGPPSGKAVSIEITGNDFDIILDIAKRMKAFIEDSDIRGIENLTIDTNKNKPEILVEVDREKARRFGLSTYSVANELRTALFGKEISKYKKGKEDYKVQLRMADEYRYDLETLMNKRITFRNSNSGKMHQVPISAVATARLSSTYGSVKREELKRVVKITSNVIGNYNPTEVNKQIEQQLAQFQMPFGYDYTFGGEQEKQKEEMSFLSSALFLAIFTIFIIIVAQFNKITVPIMIIMSVVFSTIGVFLGLIIFQMDFIIIMTMVGIISLAGVVVNNSIVLVDFIELKQQRLKNDLGVDILSLEQITSMIVEAGRTRLRPVLLTAITTVLGLIPLAVGINIDFLKALSKYDPDFYLGGDSVIFWGPLSWTIIFGLVFATFLTLIVIPVMYLLVEKMRNRSSKVT